ncbi:MULTISPECIES: molybdate ABC transporter permease subunit [unclassified Tolypothrix]|uniref:molybdate ABC transporter permease subunit n=1 Tax=unclassified Tolypothrix TaxID=2649714 RepID=UPI0005EAB3A8|nr:MULTISPECIES: molybdate ABC transporter permease subunit [unclassified Tolypothrix]BAY92395.1 ABC transporter ATP-binding protein [Microchaete diplosiphon NIES-3275]EKF05912.1 molybdate ABC transporter, permease protein [Tolypothrix sp. PCC 7601]MBE9086266.1 molybdate ABC transporter permease subunit [Tolypothrix sp. LEGE 11397]UYD26356.1 molybdate ABC transporter permease subunit [Tolypothrix sp. PCC 7712]UYD31408.1 molybdate ABC transporter permease subunit [Tolypothrix sp. PCC 7601]
MAPDLSPLWISLKTSLLATFITFFLGIAAAYWMLGYRGKAKSLIEGLFVAPLILPPTVVGFLLLIFFGKNGPVGKLMQPFDFSIVFTWYGAAIAATVVSFPLMYKTALGAFEQIDSNLLRVARTLGATESTIFWRISLPLALPGILAATTLAFARALGEFGATLMLAGNIPGQTQTIPMAIYFAVEAGAMDEAWFWSIVIMAISLSGIIAVNFWQESREKGRRGNREKRGRGQNIPAEESSVLPKLSSTVGLIIDIEKQLPSFHLKVAFNSDEQTLGLLGGSGAGKSMILRCIAGIETPTQGRIVLNGKVLFDSEQRINLPSRDRRIGFLVQNYALFPHMTVAQNIAFGLPKGLSKGSIRVQVEQQLLAMQLQGLGDRYPHQLSGGQQQRVALARALASQPEALLLDEPFSALDTHLRSQLEQQMTETLADYNGVSLFVTHNMEEAYRVCPNLLVLEHGSAVQYGSKHDIFEHPITVGVARITGCKNFSVAQLPGAGLIEASDWGCHLQVMDAIPDNITHVGIRAHQISFTNVPNQENTFPCWLARTSETPHRMTLFLKLHSAANNPQDYHLQAEVFKEKWATMKDQPFPWYLCLDPLRLILME